MSVKELKGITPLFQTELTRQIGKVTDAMDSGDYRMAYGMLKTLICSLNPTDSKYFMKNDVAHIEDQIARAHANSRTIDRYATKRNRAIAEERILRSQLRGLFWKVMTRLHEKGYLEVHIAPRASSSGRLQI